MSIAVIRPWRRRESVGRTRSCPIGRPLATIFFVAAMAPAIASAQPSVTDGVEARAAAQEPPEFYAVEPVLREFVTRALDANPGLREADARHRTAVERASQATALPNLDVSFTQMLRSVETRVGPQLNSFMVTQAFPWFGTLDLRSQVAEGDAAAALALWQARRRDVIALVKSTFYDLGYVDAAIVITEEEQSILEHYEQLAQDRYATGDSLQQAVIKIQAELTKVLNRQFTLRQQRTTLVARMNTLTDRPPNDPIPVIRLDDPPLAVVGALDVELLVATGETSRHEIRATDALIERGAHAVDLAGKREWPELRVGAGMINVGRSGVTASAPDAGKNAWTVSVGMSLPLWRNRLDAGVRAAGEEIAVQQQVRAKFVNDVEFDVQDQVGRLQTLADQIHLFENVLIPQAREVQRSTEAAYQTGQVGVLDLLDSERVLLDAQLASERQRADFLVALATLEHAIGTRFPR